MKRNILSLLLLAMMAIAALADVGIVDTGTTNSIAPSVLSSTSMGNAVKIAKTDSVGVLMSFQGTGSGTGIITYTWARSVDGITFETAPRFTTLATLNGATAVANYTNLLAQTIGAAQYIKLVSISNADGTISATNATVKVIVKTIKPSP